MEHIHSGLSETPASIKKSLQQQVIHTDHEA